eukprot:TRINITY_DN35970_c0_g2_i1.p1 TRINITY_DN35970_c0_g2~~TRINITY_DN35970_c0_g2_i1.p1  ORF type:complete len:708 (-),score=188.97 TRINITY_DN35970_c0_g2_i1:1504-3627(-)
MYALFKALPRALTDEMKEQRAEIMAVVRERAADAKTKENVLKKLFLLKHQLEKPGLSSDQMRIEIAAFTLKIREISVENELGDYFEPKLIALSDHWNPMQYADEWISDMESGEVRDGRFDPFPKRKGDKKFLQEMEEKKSHVFDRVPQLLALPAVASDRAVGIAIHGDVTYGILPMEDRVGPAFLRDYKEDFPVLCFRSADNKFQECNCWFPLAPSENFNFGHNQVAASRFMSLAKASLGIIMNGAPEKCPSAEQCCGVMLKVLSSYYQLALKEDGRVDDQKLKIMRRLLTSVNFVFSRIDQDNEVRNLWHREIFTFLVDRERMGPRLGNMRELLQKALLCGIPWSHVTQSFIREFVVRSVRKFKMRDNASPLDYYRHLENQVLGELKGFLLMIALNRNQMENDTIQTIRDVSTLRDAFLLLGVIPLTQRNMFVEKEIMKLISWALKQPQIDIGKLENVALVPYSGKQLADFRDNKLLSVAQVPIREFWKTRQIALDSEMSQLVAAHRHLVEVPTKDNFKNNMCYYCHEVFADRNSLFRTHLEPIFSAREGRSVNLRDREDPLYGRLSAHQNFFLAPGEVRFKVENEGGKAIIKCAVPACFASFKSEKELNAHQKRFGVDFDWSSVEVEVVGDEKSAADKHADAKDGDAGHDDISECVVCFENMVNAMVIPCGHQHFCMDCIISVKAAAGGCPYCRGSIRDIIEIKL